MIAVITGATKGIGYAIAQKMAKEGFDLIICSRNKEELGRVSEVLQASYRVNVLSFEADCSDAQQVKAFGQFVLDNADKIAVLVNNVGYFVPSFVLDEPEGLLLEMLNTNLYSAYWLTRIIAPKMIANQKGHIFNICSIAAIEPVSNAGSYSISKAALLSFSKSIREELRPHHVKVTAILPGATLTDSWKGTTIPSNQFIDPEDIANVIYTTYVMREGTLTEEIVIRPTLGNTD